MITEYDFNLASGSNSWKRVGDTHPVDLYYGKDEKGRQYRWLKIYRVLAIGQQTATPIL